jgi:hypothetical protein
MARPFKVPEPERPRRSPEQQLEEILLSFSMRPQKEIVDEVCRVRTSAGFILRRKTA